MSPHMEFSHERLWHWLNVTICVRIMWPKVSCKSQQHFKPFILNLLSLLRFILSQALLGHYRQFRFILGGARIKQFGTR